MDAWGWAFRRGGVAEFVISREHFTHADGTVFEFLTRITRRGDGRMFLMRVENIEHLRDLVHEFVPDEVRATSDDAEALLVAVLDQRPSDRVH